jgi:hypothetical protein
MFSPFLRKPFKQAAAAGVIPKSLATIAGTWGAVSDQGDLTYLNLVSLPACDGTDPADLTRGEMEGRAQAIHAIEALRKFMPGCESAKLRNFGMTLGVRDTRKIDALYNLTAANVREQGRFEDSIGIFSRVHRRLRPADPADDRPLLSRPVSLAGAAQCREPDRCRTLHRRRQDLARGRAQHDVLHRERPGRGHGRGGLAENRSVVCQPRPRARPGRAENARARESPDAALPRQAIDQHCDPLRVRRQRFDPREFTRCVGIPASVAAEPVEAWQEVRDEADVAGAAVARVECPVPARGRDRGLRRRGP